MRRLQTLVLTGLTFAALPSPCPAAVNWMAEVGQAQQAAQQQQKLLLLHFYADWCAPCRRLDREVFPRADVAEAMGLSFVPVKIDAERFPDLARQYEVNRFPTDVICDPAGRVLLRTVTPSNPAQYIQLLNNVVSSHRAVQSNFALASSNQPARPGNAAAGIPSSLDDRWQGEADQMTRAAASAESVARNVAYSAGNNEPRPPQTGLPRYQGEAWPNSAPQAGAGPAAPPLSPPPNAAQYALQNATQYPPQYSPAGPDPRASQYAPQHAVRDGEPSGPRASDQLNPYAGTGVPAEPRRDAPSALADHEAWRGDPRSPREPEAGAMFASAEMAQSPMQGQRLTPHQSPLASQPPAGPRVEAPIALDGYCPATLAENDSWQPGDPRWGAIHRGRTYFFVSEAHQQRFLADPDRFSPVLSGYDATRLIDSGEAIVGKRGHGMWFRGKMYLFADEASLERFQRAPEHYAQRAHEVMMRGGLR